MEYKICVIGVGFVGEHLLENFKRGYDVIGIDLSINRIRILKSKKKVCIIVSFQQRLNMLEMRCFRG